MLTCKINEKTKTATVEFSCEIDLANCLRVEPVLDDQSQPVPGEFRRVMADADVVQHAMAEAQRAFALALQSHGTTDDHAEQRRAELEAELERLAAAKPDVSFVGG